jgi:hypothetical protein
MELPMCNAIRIVTAVLAVAVLTLLAVVPLVAGWRTSAEQRAAPVSIDALELMQAKDWPGPQIQGLLLVY